MEKLLSDGSLANHPRSGDWVPYPMEVDDRCSHCGNWVKMEGGCVDGDTGDVYCYACWRASVYEWIRH